MAPQATKSNAEFGRGLARAFAGAMIFGLPLLMTMEMWELGFYMAPGRLALLLASLFPVLVVLSWHAGFEPTFSWRDDVVDAFVAVAVGFASAVLVLGALGLLDRAMSTRELVGMVSLQAVPASIGALLAQTQLGQEAAGRASGPGPRYASELFIMGVGALFLAFNLAPTEEMLLIAHRMAPWQGLLLAVASLALMHAFVYSVAFRGQPGNEARHAAWSLFLRFTVTGYALALVLGAAMLWSFGRFDGTSLAASLQVAVVLGFPAGLGAAAARLIL